MLKSDDKCKFELHGYLTPHLFSSFQLLYMPLLGQDGATLYTTMLAIAQQTTIKNHMLLQRISGLSMEMIERNRDLLEQYLLLKTYYHGAKNTYVYALYMPKEGNEFLRHDVFGRYYIQKMGKQVYEFNKQAFAHYFDDKEGYQEISNAIPNILHQWDDKSEALFDKSKPQTRLDEATIPVLFNYDIFLSDLSPMILPLSQRSAEILQYIGEKATIYGVDEKTMQGLVGKSMNLVTHTLDKSKLLSQLRRVKKEYTGKESNLYLMPPVRFLQSKQQGIRPSASDQFLLDDILIGQYKLKPDVVNVLVEYVLEKCEQKLTRSYAEKVASTWVRKHIDTHEKALQQIKEEQEPKQRYKKPQDKELPEWYTNQDAVEANIDDYDDKAFQEKMRKLRGE